MASNESMRETLEYFKQQRSAKLDEVRQMESTIRQLERELGEEPSGFESDSQIVQSTEQSQKSNSLAFVEKGRELVGDEFFGLSQPEAARRYLKKVGRAVPVDEILIALQKGGCAVSHSADPKKVLYISMVRDTRNFVRVPNGMIGLRDFYGDRNLKIEKKSKSPIRKKVTAKRARAQSKKHEEKKGKLEETTTA